MHLEVQASLLSGAFIVQRLVFFFKHQLDKFERQRGVGSGLSLFEEDHTISTRLVAVRTRFLPILRQVAIEFAELTTHYSLQEMIRYNSIVGARNEWLSLMTDTLLDTPVEEQGGPTGFTLESKIHKIHW